jgi:hypothetical protein
MNCSAEQDSETLAKERKLNELPKLTASSTEKPACIGVRLDDWSENPDPILRACLKLRAEPKLAKFNTLTADPNLV